MKLVGSHSLSPQEEVLIPLLYYCIYIRCLSLNGVQWISRAQYLCFCVFCLLSYRLEGTEEKFRNRESRPEDLQIIAELKDMVSERESLVKKLVVGNMVR